MKRKPGRPPLPADQRRVPFSLKIRERLLGRLRDFAFRERTPCNVTIERALVRYLDRFDRKVT